MNQTSVALKSISLVSKPVSFLSKQTSFFSKQVSFIAKIVLLLCIALSPFNVTAEEPAKTPVAKTTETGKVNINTADANLLAETLKGIGLKKATAIVEYRTTYGPFHDIKELAEVAGIGPATLEKNAHLISVQ